MLPQNRDESKKLARRLKAIRAGTILHQKYPGHARNAGSLGGRACVEKHPIMRTSEWGRALATARELKRAMARAAWEHEVVRLKK